MSCHPYRINKPSHLLQKDLSNETNNRKCKDETLSTGNGKNQQTKAALLHHQSVLQVQISLEELSQLHHNSQKAPRFFLSPKHKAVIADRKA